jgi:hypothetical protein
METNRSQLIQRSLVNTTFFEIDMRVLDDIVDYAMVDRSLSGV